MTSNFPVRLLISSREVGCHFSVWMNSTKHIKPQMISVFCDQKPLLANHFWRMLFIRQNFKSFPHMFFWWTFELPLNNSIPFGVWYLTASKEIIRNTILFKEILLVNTYSKGNKRWNKSKGKYIFTCLKCWCWTIHILFNAELNFP